MLIIVSLWTIIMLLCKCLPLSRNEREINMSEIIVIIAAVIIALFMTVKPEMFVLNEARRTPKFLKSLRAIGMSVCIVLLAIFIVEYIL